jgi:excisionase family DNA binding protein
MASDSRLLYTYSEVETLLGVCHKTIYNWAKAGRLDVVGTGIGCRITRVSLERLCGVRP